MRNLIHILTITIGSCFTIVLTSCDSVLELEPESSVINFWNNNTDAELGVNGIYDRMQKAYKAKHFYWGEFRGDNYTESTLPNPKIGSIVTNQLTPDQAIYTQWNALYAMIYSANLAIENIPKINDFDPNLLGEAHVLRAYAYFDAYRVWGGVPLRTEATLYYEQNLAIGRAEKEEVLELILSDIQKAQDFISIEKRDYRFSKVSVLAFKAKVFLSISDTEFNEWNNMQEIPLTLNRFEIAKNSLDELKNLGLYKLTTDATAWRNLFLNDNRRFPGVGQEGPELILSIKNNIVSDGNGAGAVYNMFTNNIPPQIISVDLLQTWSDAFPDATRTIKIKDLDTGNVITIPRPNDYRYDESVNISGTDGNVRKVYKYAKGSISGSVDDTNIVLFRYADIILLLAEAENQLGNEQTAIDLLNEIRRARQLDEVLLADFPSKEARENLILDERRFEFLGEASRWWDLLRTNKTGLTEENNLWPLNRQELIINPKLEQNEYYK